MSHDVRINEASEWDWNNSSEVMIEVGESFVVAPTNKNSKTTDDEDEPHDNLKCEVCKICMIRQMRYTLYVFWQMQKKSALKRRCETKSGKLQWMRRLK